MIRHKLNLGAGQTRPRYRPKGLIAFGLVLMGSLFGLAQSKAEDPFAQCEAAFLAEPDHWRGAGCFYDTGLTKGLEVEAAARLRALIEAHPDKAWLYFNLGRIAFDRGESEAVSAFEKAVAIFVEQGDISGEVYSRLNLYKWFVSFENIAAAEAQLAAVGVATARSEDANLQAQYQIHQALHEIQIGKDFEAAFHSLLKMAEFAFPDGPYSLRRDCLLWLGGVCLKLDRKEQARHYYQRLAKLAKDKGDQALEANALLHQAMIAVLAEEQLEQSRENAIALAQEALAIAEKVDRPDLRAETSRLLGQLTDGETGLTHLQQAVAAAEALSEPLIWAECLGSLAKATAIASPKLAEDYIAQAYELIADSEQPWTMMIWLYNSMRVHYQTSPAQNALDQAFSALDYVESSQSGQFTESSKIGLFSVWSEMYYWLAGTLLKDRPLGDRISIEKAFSAMARMRARVLLEAIQQGDDEPSKENDTLKAIGNDISALNRKLFDVKLDSHTRVTILEELRDKEFAFQKLKSEINPRDSEASLKAEAFPSLADIETALDDDQAILSYQIAETENVYGEFGGGSWLLVITSSGTRVYNMPDRQKLAPAIRTYLGLMANTSNDAIFKEVSASFYDRLLKAAIHDLPPKIKRLILIPDGPLHRLPFGGLSQSPTAPPLIETYQISRIPSTTVWWHCQDRKPPRDGRGGLVFADPSLPQSHPTTETPTRSWTQVGGTGLEPLPLSRQEGENVVASLGGQSQLFLGGNASEAQLKQMDLQPFQVLHFAAHAIVDEVAPQRSAVVLTPGNDQQDGLLQPNEIETLPLNGQIVVLSTCSSASGQVFKGEGAMSLARAFLKAGASVVVATLQPLRDDAASFFFNHFYRALAKGHPVAYAIQTAQKESIASGQPPAAWAPVVAICRDEVRLKDMAFILTPLQIAIGIAVLFVLFFMLFRKNSKRLPFPSRPSGAIS